MGGMSEHVSNSIDFWPGQHVKHWGTECKIMDTDPERGLLICDIENPEITRWAEPDQCERI